MRRRDRIGTLVNKSDGARMHQQQNNELGKSLLCRHVQRGLARFFG